LSTRLADDPVIRTGAIKGQAEETTAIDPGSKTRISHSIFGGPEQFSAALTELERQLYQDSA
jgi:hypothetical protein